MLKSLIAEARSLLAEVSSLTAGKWYMQGFPGETLYFKAITQQKNGGWAGTLVTLGTSPTPKVKKYSVPKMGFGLWKVVDELPKEVEGAVNEALEESVSRYAGIWKDSAGNWWLDLADEEYGEYEDARTHGPFSSEDAADSYLSKNFSNPGGADVDDSGKKAPPKKSRNGSSLVNPRKAQKFY
jgi:hypothetical protein